MLGPPGTPPAGSPHWCSRLPREGASAGAKQPLSLSLAACALLSLSACSLGTSWYWHKTALIAKLVSDTSSLSQSVSDSSKWPWPVSHPTGATLANTPKLGSGFHLVFPIVYGFPAKFSSPVNLFSSKSIKCNSAGNSSWRSDLRVGIALCQGWANSFESKPLSDCYCYLSTQLVKKDKSRGRQEKVKHSHFPLLQAYIVVFQWNGLLVWHH